MTPLLSIIVPAYNHGSLIGRTIDSILSQTFTDYEIIVINDGSTDYTAENLQPFIQAKQIKYMEQENAGQAAARNSGLAKASGKYIGFVDDDDVLPPDKFQWQIDLLEHHSDIEAVAGRAQFIDSRGEPLTYVSDWTPCLSFAHLFDGNPIITPGQVLLRTSALRRVGALNESLWGADDWDLWFNIAKAGPILMYDRIALYYRVHDTNATKQSRRLYDNSRRAIEGQLTKLSGKEQREMRRRAYTFLCNAWIRKLAAHAKESFRSAEFTEGFKDLFAMLKLLRGITELPSIPSRIILELIPVRISRWLPALLRW